MRGEALMLKTPLDYPNNIYVKARLATLTTMSLSKVEVWYSNVIFQCGEGGGTMERHFGLGRCKNISIALSALSEYGL